MYMPAHSRNKIRMIKHIDNVIQHIYIFFFLTIQVHNSNEDFHVGMEIQIFYVGRSSKKLFESYHLFFFFKYCTVNNACYHNITDNMDRCKPSTATQHSYTTQ